MLQSIKKVLKRVFPPSIFILVREIDRLEARIIHIENMLAKQAEQTDLQTKMLDNFTKQAEVQAEFIGNTIERQGAIIEDQKDMIRDKAIDIILRISKLETSLERGDVIETAPEDKNPE